VKLCTKGSSREGHRRMKFCDGLHMLVFLLITNQAASARERSSNHSNACDIGLWLDRISSKKRDASPAKMSRLEEDIHSLSED